MLKKHRAHLMLLEGGHFVAEPDRRQRHKRIVYGVRVRPLLEIRKQARRQENEEHHAGHQIDENASDQRESHRNVVLGRSHLVRFVTHVDAHKLKKT